jgi:hypothetical protein
MVPHVGVDVVRSHAGVHLPHTRGNAVHQSPHTFDGLSARSHSAVCKVKRKGSLTLPHMTHQVHFWDQVLPFSKGDLEGSLQVLGQAIEASLEPADVLAVHIVGVYYGRSDLPN